MNTAGRAVVFAGSTVVISLLGMLIMQLSFVSGMAIGMAVVVALTLLASLTLLPALLGFAGERIELDPPARADRRRADRRRLDRRRARDPRPAGRHPSGRGGGAAGQLRRLLVAQAGTRTGAQAVARDLVVPVEPRDPASPVDSSADRSGRAGRVGAAGPRAPARVLRRRQLPRRHHHPPGVRPLGRRVRSRLQRPPQPGDGSATGHRSGRAPSDHRRHRGRLRRGVRQRPDHQRRHRADRRAVAGRPDDRPAGRRDDGPRRTGCATTSSPPRPPAPASTSPSPEASPSASTSPTTCPSACPTSSPPCWGCRSCC